jgi:hypothetical protein
MEGIQGQPHAVKTKSYPSLRERPRKFLKLLMRGHRNRAQFADVRAFCCFVGYPRSGHTLIGAMLNAHKNAVIAHELNVPEFLASGYRRNQIYWLILRRDRKFTHGGSVGAGYDYEIPGQWQGRSESLQVIGDKRGGAVSRAFANDPTLFDRLARRVKVPLRIIHVVRNPWDNIATISQRHDMNLVDAASYYFTMCDSVTRIAATLSEREFFTLRHEEFLDAPKQHLGDLCSFLELPLYPGYVEDCSALVWSAPTKPRERVDWPETLRGEIAERATRHPHLCGYVFDV